MENECVRPERKVAPKINGNIHKQQGNPTPIWQAAGTLNTAAFCSFPQSPEISFYNKLASQVNMKSHLQREGAGESIIQPHCLPFLQSPAKVPHLSNSIISQRTRKPTAEVHTEPHREEYGA